MQRLANQLQALRDVVGAITINSCYRTLAHNTEIGGATNSQHLTAKAADFVVPGVSKADVYCAVLRLIPGSMEEGGLGWYGEGGHIHYDVRGFKRRWNETDGALPVCPPVVSPPQEDEDMSLILVRKKGERKMYKTDWGLLFQHVTAEERDALVRLSVPVLDPVPEWMEELFDNTKAAADAVRAGSPAASPVSLKGTFQATAS